jgi:phosphoadenosine phosphosulfate reductase
MAILDAPVPRGQRHSVHDDLRRIIAAEAPRSAVFTTSFGLEDQVLTHLLHEAGLAAQLRFATLDTGRLFPETYDLWEETERRYGIVIESFAPRGPAIEDFVARNGVNGFRSSIELRKECCSLRKLEPLERALAGAVIWITGLRADQSAARQQIRLTEVDAQRGLTKLNPLHDWSRDDLVAFAERHAVPVSPLHARGFLSIGCAPCTRAIAPGEPERAGRWWWEEEAAKECGLHVGPDGRLARQKAEATA